MRRSTIHTSTPQVTTSRQPEKSEFCISNIHESSMIFVSDTMESFHVKRSNLVEVRARTDPDLPSFVIFHVFQ